MFLSNTNKITYYVPYKIHSYNTAYNEDIVFFKEKYLKCKTEVVNAALT